MTDNWLSVVLNTGLANGSSSETVGSVTFSVLLHPSPVSRVLPLEPVKSRLTFAGSENL